MNKNTYTYGFRNVLFYIFLIVTVLTVIFYAYPRMEYDQKSSKVSVGFEEGYSAEIIDFYMVRDIDQIGLAGDRVVFVYDFSRIPESKFEEYLKMRQGMKVIFYEKPYEGLTSDDFAEKLDRYDIEVRILSKIRAQADKTAVALPHAATISG